MLYKHDPAPGHSGATSPTLRFRVPAVQKTQCQPESLPRLVVPPPRAAVDLTMADGAVVRLRRHGNPSGPRLALSHGNGLASDAYLPFWSLLAQRYDVVLFDMRNHGINPLHGGAGHDYAHFTRDIGAVRRGIDAAFGAKPVTGVFHSLAAIAATHNLVEGGPAWDALVLFDPPFMGRTAHPGAAAHQAYMADMAARARRRPERYRDPRVFAFQLMGAKEFRLWVAGAHTLFAEFDAAARSGGGRLDTRLSARARGARLRDQCRRRALAAPRRPWRAAQVHRRRSRDRGRAADPRPCARHGGRARCGL